MSLCQYCGLKIFQLKQYSTISIVVRDEGSGLRDQFPGQSCLT